MSAPILFALRGAELLIVGDAPGVDEIALEEAIRSDCIVRVHCADRAKWERLRRRGANVDAFLDAEWSKQGRTAGTIRNAAMVRDAFDTQALLGASVEGHAFPLPGSRGTWDCYHQCRTAGINIRLHNPHPGETHA